MAAEPLLRHLLPLLLTCSLAVKVKELRDCGKCVSGGSESLSRSLVVLSFSSAEDDACLTHGEVTKVDLKLNSVFFVFCIFSFHIEKLYHIKRHILLPVAFKLLCVEL